MVLNLQKYLLHTPFFSNFHCRKFAIFSSAQSHVLSTIKVCKRVEELKPLKSLIIVNGLTDYKLIISEFIQQCFHLGNPEFGLSAFYASNNRSLLLQNLIIKHLCNFGLYQDVISVYKTCKLLGTSNGNYTFPYVIKACSALCDVELGREIHGIVIRTGYDRNNVFVHTAFVDFYAKVGRMDIARFVFDRMSQRDVVSWNALISGYSFNGLDYEALKVLQELWVKGVKLYVTTLASIVPVCTRLAFRNLGRSLHGYAVKCGFHEDEMLTPALISMYANNGDIRVARCLFDRSPINNVVIRNSIIYAHAQNQMPDVALGMFQEMLFADLRPNVATFVSVIPCCEKLNIIYLGEILHGYVIKYGINNQVSVATALISMYEKLGDVHSAVNVFTWMPHKNLLTWNSIISAYVHHGFAQTSLNAVHEMQVAGLEADLISVINILSACSELHALLLAAYFSGMQLEGVQPDVVSLISVLPSLQKAGDLAQGMVFHGLALKLGFTYDVTLANALISMYSSCSDLDAAALVFHTMTDRCLVSWNSLITGYRTQNSHKEVTYLFKEMKRNGHNPNYITLLNVLPGCSTLLQGKSIHSYAIRIGAIQQTPLVTSLISMYSRFNNIVSCFLLFEAGDQLDISVWNVMMSILLEARETEKTFSFFFELLQTEVKVDYMTILSAVSACIQLNNISVTNSVLAFVIKNGLLRETTVCNAFIDLYAKCGDLPMAREVFKNLLEKDSVSWSVMINGYGLHGDGDAAITLLAEMEDSGMKPDNITYLSVLSACSHAGLAEQSMIIFNSMLYNGFRPTNEHYGCVADLLGRKGLVLEAYDIVKRMPSEASVSMLESLLGACMVHGNVEIGERVGEMLIYRDPKNTGAYVKLHNIYAGAGRWQDANRLRSMMEERELSKVAGFSMLEGQKL
ncbi:pentatricopeptide repeat-containing protein At3g16610 isoform X2 [Beta vulgaris subsp. vulgaris]|uniref:pentatricopeptide repeat-containing protein At3g16610 isoform X2 n=1 Tax=Beta vulgaris subsp. vulgaris TaxID=3555 RepID=UPI002036B0FE|nr:pentatricopeptide repeat-containing protein At3g16610 isoform X2 [Beta vulgaris subsp. vulgaris]